MNIKEMMSLDIFQSSKLLTGNIGLENDINSVMVLEAVDIEKWSRKNQLILTSFYAFDNLTQEEMRTFFKKMHTIGVSGLVVKMERLIKIIPEWMVDLCFEFQIPLIKVEQNITYEQIMLTIYEPILNYQSHILRTYYEVRQRFTKINRNLSSFDQIMREFYQLIKKDCALLIPDSDIQISYGAPHKDAVIGHQIKMDNSEFTKNHYELLTLYSQKDAQETTALKVSITNNFTADCTLLVYQKSKDFKETDLMIIENAVDILQEKMQMEYLIKKDRYARLNNLADAILQNTPSNIHELDSLLNEADMNQFPYYQGIAFSTKSFNSNQLKKQVRDTLRTLMKHEIFFEHHNYLIILYNFSETETAVGKSDLKKIFKDIFTLHDYLTFAVSSVKEKENLKEILIECLEIIRFNREFYIDNVVETADLGIFHHFIREGKLEEIEKIVPAELAQLYRHNPDLFETLYTFFQTNRSYKKTAEALFLHSKTIRYRLTKIENLLDIDLCNPVQMINYELGAYLLKLKRRKMG